MFLALIFTKVDALLANTRIMKNLVYQLIFRIYRLVLHVIIILTLENPPQPTNDAH